MSTDQTNSTDLIDGFQTGKDEELLRVIRRNIESLRRERALGTKIDPRSIDQLEAEYRKLAATLQNGKV